MQSISVINASNTVEYRNSEMANTETANSEISSLRITDPLESPWIIEEEEEDEEDDVTCCHRAYFCPQKLRNVIVTNVISKCLELELTWANIFSFLTILGMILLAWIILYFLLGDMMLPGGFLFDFFVLVIFAYVLGWTLARIPHLHIPPVVGMLLAGIIMRNTDLYDIREELGIAATSKIRVFCQTFVMIRAGLRLTTTSLRAHPGFLIVLAFVPCSFEMVIITILTRFLLEYPWNWSFMTGACMACMSPAVTIGAMLNLSEDGYGEDKGIGSILCTAAAMEDILMVSLYTICFSFVFSNEEHKKIWWFQIPGGIRDILLGCMMGIILGLSLVFFPHRSHKYVTPYRIVALSLASLTCTTSTTPLGITGGGYLAAIILSFIAVRGWRLLTVRFDNAPFQKAFYILWYFLQPILGGVTGANIDFRDWTLQRTGLYFACVIIGVLLRASATFLTSHKMSFTWKERVFIAIAWMSKGTLQAALASMALERAIKINDPEKIEMALDMVRLGVICVVFLSPFSSFAMMTTGPLLLSKITLEQYQRQRALSYARSHALHRRKPL